MQHSKLPKLASVKSLQVRPLGTLSENRVLLSQAQEAPASTYKTAIMRAPLRRSRSVSDLRTVKEDQPLKNLPKVKLNLRARAAPIKTAPAITKMATSKTTKTAVGAKRPLDSQIEEGATKPKVFKKIPDWDYKARFNQLNEKYQISQNALKTMKEDVLEIEELRASNTELTAQVKSLTQKNQQLYKNIETQEEKNIHLISTNQSLNDQLSESIKKNKALEEQITGLKQELIWFESERRIWHEVIQDLKGNIRVFCRVRPSLANEENKVECPISFPEENSLVLRRKNVNVNQITGKSQDGRSEFCFDKVFGPSSSQENIFEDLEQLVQSALDGYNICVFAYGQTGSGKTYTMQGGEGAHQGVIPRTIYLIFERIEKLKRTGWEYSVQVSFVEIYNENVRDLLNLSSSQRLDICFNEGRGTIVNNLTQQTVESASELEFFMKKAHQCRATAATDFNEHSSRSHAITKIFLKGVNQEQNLTYEGSINLVDLAGSESAKNAIAGERLNETKNINKSLAVLGDVICALFNKSRHIPYRNSKLTFLLQSSLSGNSKTIMIVNIAPFEECFGESISALRFAAKVKEVKTHSKRNKAVCDVARTPK